MFGQYNKLDLDFSNFMFLFPMFPTKMTSTCYSLQHLSIRVVVVMIIAHINGALAYAHTKHANTSLSLLSPSSAAAIQRGIDQHAFVFVIGSHYRYSIHMHKLSNLPYSKRYVGAKPDPAKASGYIRYHTFVEFDCIVSPWYSHPIFQGLTNTHVPENEGQHMQEIYPPASHLGGIRHWTRHPEACINASSPLVTDANRLLLYRSWVISPPPPSNNAAL